MFGATVDRLGQKRRIDDDSSSSDDDDDGTPVRRQVRFKCCVFLNHNFGDICTS
jgi:hypothetical protein